MSTGFTGHPLIDAGLAALTVLAGKTRPDDLTLDDCQAVADWLYNNLYTTYDAVSGLYAQGPFKSYLVWLFPNSVWVNALSKDLEKASESLKAYAQRTLYAFAAPTSPDAQACSFCGKPASMHDASRSQVPLLSGKYPNFGPTGLVGVPVCGRCLLAIHALPLGGFVTTGRRLMVVHSNNNDLLMQMAHRAVEHNRAAMLQARLADWPQLPYPRTRLVSMLRTLERTAPDALGDAITLYHFTNDNRGADLAIHRLASSVLAFLREVEHPYDRERHSAWLGAVHRAWKGRKGADGVDEQSDRNALYEDLYALPAGAQKFLRQYILPARSWALAACFIRKVMGMDEDQLNLLYSLGTRFAAYAREKRSFYFDFTRETHQATWRRRLLSAADTWSRRGEVLITAEEFVKAFVAPPRAEFFDWRLARDIVALRMMEELARTGDITPDDEELLPADLDEAEDTD